MFIIVHYIAVQIGFVLSNFRTTSRSDFTFYADRLVSWKIFFYCCVVCDIKPVFLADRTIGRAYGTVCRLSICLSICPSVCNVLYCGKTVCPSEKVSEGVNRKPGSKSSFFGSPPYFYFRVRRYGHRDGRFRLIFARTAKQSVLDGRNLLSSSKPCAYCRIVRSELKLDSVLFVFIT